MELHPPGSLPVLCCLCVHCAVVCQLSDSGKCRVRKEVINVVQENDPILSLGVILMLPGLRARVLGQVSLSVLCCGGGVLPTTYSLLVQFVPMVWNLVEGFITTKQYYMNVFLVLSNLNKVMCG